MINNKIYYIKALFSSNKLGRVINGSSASIVDLTFPIILSTKHNV